MVDKKLTAKFKKICLDSGADLVGVASPDRFEGAPKEMDPRYIFPEAKAIVVLGFRIPRGCFRGIEEGTYWAAYPISGYWYINYIESLRVLRECTLFLEDLGYESIPLPNLFISPSVDLYTGKKIEEKIKKFSKDDLDVLKKMKGDAILKEAVRSVSKDKPAPDVTPNFRLAAVAAGLGEIGVSKMLLTPEFGPRQRLALLITDAPLKADPLFDGKICDKCMKCVKECPVNAISRNEVVRLHVGGKEVQWHKIDSVRCTLGNSGGSPETSPFVPKNYNFEEKIKGGQEGALKAVVSIPYNSSSYEMFNSSGVIGGAKGCIRECMIHLEEKGRIMAKFRQPFRKKPLWKL